MRENKYLRNEEEAGVMELDGWHGSSGSTISATIRGDQTKEERSKGKECVPRHNDYMGSWGSRKCWRGK